MSSPEKDEIVHRYGDIEEMDNELPKWWLYILYGSIVFAFGYWFHYQVFRSGESPTQAYAREVEAARAVEADRVRAAGVMSNEALLTLSRDTATVAKGKDVFAQTCVACHGANGGGTIGPNLTDSAWIHGGAAQNVFATVRDGVIAKGMPVWGPQLGAERVQAVTAYVLTLRNTNVPGGKAPQGTNEAM